MEDEKSLIFSIQQFDLSLEKNFDTHVAFIELRPNIFRYRAAYRSDTWVDDEDKSRGVVNLLTDFDIKIKKETFVSIAKYWRDREDGKYWYLELEFNGYPHNIKLFFAPDNKKGMMEVYEALQEYFGI